MRYSRQHKEETHNRLLKKAAEEFRRNGVQGTGIAPLMGQLKRRPDVRRADDEIAAAAANVKAAKADYFPKFTLFGSAGRQATQLHDLSLSLGNFFAVGPAISLPIFTGRRQQALRFAKVECGGGWESFPQQ